MAEILGLGLTHYPALAATDRHMTGILRGMGDMKSAARITIWRAVAALPLFFVLIFGWGPIPSLGIALDQSVRGRGYGRVLMNFLHETARKRGAAKVRLKVDSRNHPAIELYRSLGYVFEPQSGQDLVGFLDFTQKP